LTMTRNSHNASTGCAHDNATAMPWP
jgi:hypothetical protein